MQFSFEVPKFLLERSSEVNDYDYFLDILVEGKSKEYRDEIINFYVSQINKGRTVFLDNSLYERKVRDIKFNEQSYRELILDIKSKITKDRYKQLCVIVPDFYEDAHMCINKVNEYLELFPEFTLVAVVHGSSKRAFKNCFIEYSKILRDSDVIAVSAGDMCCSITPRSEILRELSLEVSWNQKVHFLGLKNPFEVLQIQTVKHLVDSIDTSYPVICSIEGNKVFITSEKPKTLIFDIFDVFDTDLENETVELYYNNTNTFKRLFLGAQNG